MSVPKQSSLAAAVACLIISAAAAAFGAYRSTVILEWEMTPGQTIPDGFVLHATNDLSAPLTNWPVYTTYVSTNVWSISNQVYQSPVTNRATLPVTPGNQFFYLTASNIWGESPPSGVAGLPSTPTNGVLRIR